MQDRHSDKKQYFQEQGLTTRNEVIPYLQEYMDLNKSMSVLEIGCGEAGNLMPFLEMGCSCKGVDISAGRIEKARKLYADHPQKNNISFLCSDIYDVDVDEIGAYDLIIMRDVIEHIPNQEVFMGYVKRFMKPSGKFFLGFPPWYMPFGGHQQICSNKYLSKLPYFHILPRALYKSILKMGENEHRINELLEIKDTGISIERFLRIVKKENYKVLDFTYFLINPNYKVKFNLTPRKQFPIIKDIPFLRNFVTTCCYCLLGK